MNDIVSVTDHIKEFSVESQLLEGYFNEKMSSDTTIALVWHQTIDEDFLSKYPRLRAIVRYGVGYDNVNLGLCKRKKIIVVNTPDYGVDEVSDTAIAMILNLTRKINALQIHAKSDADYWLGKDINLNMKRLNTLSLGVVGLGRIGGSILRKFQSFSRYTSFFDPYQADGMEKIFQSKRYDNLKGLLQNSDIVSVNTPLNEETYGMIDEYFLNNMKDDSYLINVSRGPIVKNQEIILNALKSGKLQGYGTDVWQVEPPSESDELIELLNNDQEICSKVIINPHTAYYSSEALKEARTKACESCLRLIKGLKVNNRII